MEYKYFVAYITKKDEEISFHNAIVTTEEIIDSDNFSEVQEALAADAKCDSAVLLNFISVE